MKSNYISNIFKKLISLIQKYSFVRNSKVIMYYIDGILLQMMAKPKKIQSKKKKVLIVYNLAFGDGVIWRCSAAHLRKIYSKKDYEITLICQKGINKLYENDNVYDKILPVDFNKSTVNIKERVSIFKQIRSEFYDIIIDPVGIFEWTTNIFFTRAAVGTKKIGLRDINVKLYCNSKKIKKIYTDIIEIEKPNLSLLEYYSTFVNKLSGGSLNVKPGFEKLITKKTKLKLPKRYFIIFPGASINLKRWPSERYAELAERIYNKTKFKLVLVGTSADKEATEDLKEKLNIDYMDLVCQTSLNDYIDIIKNASLVVTNDTSAYHIAVVEETPVALIAGAYTYERYALYDFPGKENYKRPCVIVKNKKCKNCNNRCRYLNKDDKIWPCLNEITVEYAWDKIEDLINLNYGGKD